MRKAWIDLAVIGGGPAGLAAALAAAEAGVEKILIFDRNEQLGGILPQCIHNGFGLRYFSEELTGPEYAWRFIERLKDYSAIQAASGTIVLELRADRSVLAVNPREGMILYRPKAVILAMGCRERSRGALNLPGTRPAGIFTAGTVQRLMNIEGLLPGKRAVILGSGDIGLIMARRLTLEGVKVQAVLELLPYSSGLKRNIVQCLEDFKIPLLLRHTVVEIMGGQRVIGVRVAPVDESLHPLNDQRFILDCDTLLLSVGLIPENELSLQAGVELDPATGGPFVDSECATNVGGIFACGNVLHLHDLVDDVSEEGRVAGQAAARWVAGTRRGHPELIKVQPGRGIRSAVPQSVIPGQSATLYLRACEPGRDLVLQVGPKIKRLKFITPGETIRYRLKAEDTQAADRTIMVSLEKGGVTPA